MLKSKLFGKKQGFQEVQYSCTVNFLSDEQPLTVAYNKEWLGEQVFDRVCQHLNLAEKHFFGLRYVDTHNQRIWLDLKKPLQKQIKGIKPLELSFRVRYYPSEPSRLKEQLTRYLLFLQLERDLRNGRILCSSSELIHLSAHQLQARFGGAVVRTGDADLSKILCKNALYTEQEILLLRNSLLHMGVAEAELKFVQLCGRLPTYGVDPTAARDVLGEIVFVGVNHGGMMVLKEGKVAVSIPWKDIGRVDYHGKLLSVQIKSPKGGSSTQHIKCASSDACKQLWKLLVDQQNFFTLEWSGDAKKVKANRGIFRRTSSFRFKGLCETDVWRSVTSLNRIEPPVVRSFSGLSHHLSGSHSVPPSIMQASYLNDFSDSLRSVSPMASPLPSRHLEAAPEEEEDDSTPNAEESVVVKVVVEKPNEEKNKLGNNADEDFHSMSELSQLEEEEEEASDDVTPTSSNSKPLSASVDSGGGERGGGGVVVDGGGVAGEDGWMASGEKTVGKKEGRRVKGWKERGVCFLRNGPISHLDYFSYKHAIFLLLIAIFYALFKLHFLF